MLSELVGHVEVTGDVCILQESPIDFLCVYEFSCGDGIEVASLVGATLDPLDIRLLIAELLFSVSWRVKQRSELHIVARFKSTHLIPHSEVFLELQVHLESVFHLLTRPLSELNRISLPSSVDSGPTFFHFFCHGFKLLVVVCDDFLTPFVRAPDC